MFFHKFDFLPLLLFCFEIFEIAAQEQNSTLSSPRVFLGGYDSDQITDLVVLNEHKNSTENRFGESIVQDNETGDISVDTKHIVRVILSCRAEYPIYWIMKDVQPDHFNGVNMRMRVKFEEMDLLSLNETEFKPKEFITHLLLDNDPSYTGLYTCRSVSDQGDMVEKDIYIFLNGYKDTKRIFTKKGQIRIGANGSRSLTIPCKVTKNDAVVDLRKKDESGDLIALNYTFDPKVGFSIERNEKISVEYVCTGEEHNETLEVKIVEDLSPIMQFPIHYLSEGGKAGWKQRTHKDGVECCSNSTAGPSLLVVECKYQPHCEMMKQIFMENNVTSRTDGVALISRKRKKNPCVHTTEYVMVQPFIMQCKGDGVDISGEFLADFEASSKQKIEYIQLPSDYTYNADRSVKTVIMKRINETREGRNFYRFKESDIDTELFIGDKFAVDCCGAFYFFAVGRVQRIGWKNGSVSLIETPDKKRWGESSPVLLDYCYTYVYTEEDEEYLLTADENMEFAECIVPLWNDTKPYVKRFQLNIREPEAPEIAPGHNVTYDENQTGLLKLDCILTKGLPRPSFTWTRNGYKINQTDIFWSVEDNALETAGSRLLFMRAVKEIEGEFECIAENPSGFTSQVFIVKIRPRSYADCWVALAVFGGFFLLILICALRVSTLEKRIFSEKIMPMENGKLHEDVDKF